MPRLALSLAMWSNPRVRGVLDGSVAIEGVDLTPTVSPPADTFWRQLRFAEFDISEMSIASLSISAAKGDQRWSVVPVFPDRIFFETRILVRKEAQIGGPEDLRGRRVSVPDYQQTAAVWTRGILEHDFGLKPGEMHWFQERLPSLSHGGATGFTAPEGVRVDQIPAETSAVEMMRRGEIDAMMLYIPYPTLLDRSPDPFDVAVPLFADHVGETRRMFGKWGFIPPNHCVVVRSELAQQYPWLPLNIFRAFSAAQAAHMREVEELTRRHREAGILGDEGNEAILRNLFPYGASANTRALTTVADFLSEQGLTPHRIDLPSLYSDPVAAT